MGYGIQGQGQTAQFLREGETVFPTSVGMNREMVAQVDRLGRVPHERGDEPKQVIGLLANQ